MYIFDCFTSSAQAQLFANRLKRLRRKSSIHVDQNESDKVHPFSWELEGWIVLVERKPEDTENTGQVLADIAENYGGEYMSIESRLLVKS